MPKLPQPPSFFFLKILKLLLNLLTAPYGRKRSLLLVFYFFSGAILFAQQKITGIVTGVNDVPLSGATITINSKIASSTNADGVFVFDAKPEDVLIISFVGYNSKQFTVGNETSFKISLTLSVNDLDQVVVTGYTAQKVKDNNRFCCGCKAKRSHCCSCRAGRANVAGKGCRINCN